MKLSQKALRLLFLATSIVFLSTCQHTWYASPRGVPNHLPCKSSGNFPQMVKIPILSNSWLLVNECDMYRREPVAIAVTLFYMEWLEQLGDPTGEVYRALNSLMIEFSDEEKRASVYDEAGYPIGMSSLSGVTMSPGWIWVKSSRDRLLCETSLAHELVHVAIWAIKKTDGDPDHTGRKYWGWQVDHSILIQDVNEDLCELGI